MGAYYSDISGNSDAGAAFIYWGGRNMPVTSTRDKYFAYPSTNDNAYFGWSVSQAGDVNGDGYQDIIVGAYQYYDSSKTATTGAAWIYFGATTPNTIPDVYLEYPGTDNNARFGYSVSKAGDVDADGYDDVVVGAYQSDYDVGTDRGAAFIYYGSSTMPATATHNVYLKYPGTDNTAYFGAPYLRLEMLTMTAMTM